MDLALRNDREAKKAGKHFNPISLRACTTKDRPLFVLSSPSRLALRV